MKEGDNVSDLVQKARDAWENGDRKGAKRFALQAIIGANIAKESYLNDVQTTVTDQQLADWYGGCSFVLNKIGEDLTATRCFYTATVFDQNWTWQSHTLVSLILWENLVYSKDFRELYLNLKSILVLLHDLDKLAKLAERRKRWSVCLAIDGDINRVFIHMRGIQIIPPEILAQPGRKEAMTRIARCYLHLNMHEDVRKTCSTILQHVCDYDNSEALEIWARSLFATQDFDLALEKNMLALKYCQDSGDRQRLEEFHEQIKQNLEESERFNSEPDESWLEGTNISSAPSSRCSSPSSQRKKKRHKRPKARDRSGQSTPRSQSLETRRSSNTPAATGGLALQNGRLVAKQMAAFDRIRLESGSSSLSRRRGRRSRNVSGSSRASSTTESSTWTETDYSISESESESDDESDSFANSSEDGSSAFEEESDIDLEDEAMKENMTFYDQSCKFYLENISHKDYSEKSGTDEKLLKFGIDLNMSFMKQLEERNRYTRNSDPFYEEFLSGDKLREKMKMNPKKYIRCTIHIEGAHEAYCQPIEADTKTDVIEISGRSKIGQCFNEDEVVVEILDNLDEKGKPFGKVLGVLNRQRHKDAKHPVFICTLEDMESHLVQPLCKTIPKLHLMHREISKRFNTEKKKRYKIEIYEYDERAGILCNPKIRTVSPAEAKSQLFLVAFISWGIQHIYPRGAIIKRLAGGNSIRTGMMILNLQHEIPTLYKRETVNQVSTMLDIDEPSPARLRGRTDLTHLNTFTIDPPDSKDLDDALSIERLESGYFRVGVHIADVSEYVPKDSALDEESKQRATTFYPGIQRPRNMIPEPLSFNICSLLQDKLRLTISVFFDLDSGGRPLQKEGNSFQIQKTFIKSKRQLTYGQAQAMINADSLETSSQLTQDIKSLFAIARKVRKRRLGNSMFSLDLDWEESRNESESDTFEAHYLVEEFMIMTNRKVAQLLRSFPSYRDCVPLRCQAPPSQEHIDEFFKRNSSYMDVVVHFQDKQVGPKRPNFDECLKQDDKKNVIVCRPVWEAIKASPKTARKYILKDDLHPLQLAVYQNWLSIQERAGYRCSGSLAGEEDGKHYGLDMFPYTHFTSPIRRYNDLVVHRLVHEAVFERSQAPYTKEEVDHICLHINSATKRAKDYEKGCKSLQQAVYLKDNPKTINCYVDEVSEKGITICSPILKYVSKRNRQMMFNLLDMWYKPEVFPDPETSWDMVKAVWRKRLYNFHVRPPNEPDKGHELKLNPNKDLVFIPQLQWARMLRCSVDDHFEDLSSAVKNTKESSRAYGHNDVTTECENPLQIQPVTKFSMTFSRGQQVQIQLTAAPYKGVIAPKPMLYNMTHNVRICLQHMADPVLHLYRYVTLPTCDQYQNIQEYLQRWLPLILMEAATGVTRTEESCCISDHPVKFTGENRGKFALGLAECEVRNIELAGTLSDEDDDDEESGQAGSYDWLCLKARVPKTDAQNPTKKSDIEVLESTWIGHAEVTKVKKNKEANPTGKLTVSFRLHEKSPALPASMHQTSSDLRIGIEILRKSEVDRRTESYIKKLPSDPKSLAVIIALNKPIPALEKSRVHMVKFTEQDLHYKEFTDEEGTVWKPLPPNNEKQQEAINKALKSRFSLIQGPPGTGKTYTGIKLIYLFNRINELLHKEGKPRKQVLFCGPSNKSVDLVARWMYYRMQPNFRPNFVRVYGRSIEAMDFPIPGRTFLSKKSTKNLQVSSDLYPVALHHIIRQKGKKYAEEITAMDKLFKDNNYRPMPEKAKEYVHLIREASIEEIRKHDVILCTTAVGSNPKVLKATDVYQVIVDEAGMCPEPQCLVPIIATNADQVVLIGDHKQLRPIILCKEAALLGLETSLFERYATSNSKQNVPFTMLDTQYRMHYEICRFPSRQFYDNMLKTEAHYGKEKRVWPSDQKGTYPHVFIHVEGEEKILTVSTEDGNEQSRSNEAEIEQVARIYKYFIDQQFGSVQILSQYNAQCAEIRRKLREKNINFNDQNISTVVSSQGGEWDYVVFSTVRSMPEYMIEKNPTLGWCKRNLGFITDQNQVNVALTRARKGLVIIGNKKLLKCDYIWKRLLRHYKERGCIKTPDDFPPEFRRKRLEIMEGNIKKSENRFGEHSKYIKGEATSYIGPIDGDEGWTKWRRF